MLVKSQVSPGKCMWKAATDWISKVILPHLDEKKIGKNYANEKCVRL